MERVQRFKDQPAVRAHAGKGGLSLTIIPFQWIGAIEDGKAIGGFHDDKEAVIFEGRLAGILRTILGLQGVYTADLIYDSKLDRYLIGCQTDVPRQELPKDGIPPVMSCVIDGTEAYTWAVEA